MKRCIKSLVLVTMLCAVALPSRAQATPSTEGRDFWVTFLRAADDNPTELKLTVSALESCVVTIENTSTGLSTQVRVGDNQAIEFVMNQADCYSSSNETVTNTALHVTSTKDISLFAGNYRDKSFDAANVLPTAALLDDYLIQTYPPSDHEGKPQGSHFAIVATEDNTVVDYNLTAKTAGNRTGMQTTPTLNKGQVWYVWTGKTEGDAADLSGTTVKARNGKKIAVFQGCPHTNIPYSVRDRDHIISQAMPLAYWGSEFGITASRMHRRDIVAVMATYDGTEVYINSEDGEKVLVHTFDFNVDKKHYWTFEIGEYLAYCADGDGQSPSHGQLPEPLITDSSCYLTTSCPVGVHLFMVSNRYDNLTPTVKSDTLVSDPAMLWISPIEQVIKEINFATYHTQQAKFHFMNILTDSANVHTMKWNNQSIAQYFHPLRGKPDYSFARIEITEGNHHLKGDVGFLAHVYGYGERESYAYSCGSSTVQRSMTFNGKPLMIDDVSDVPFCVNNDIEMKLNIGNNDYQSIVWDYGDGVTYVADMNAPDDEKKVTHHTYTTPGWYDLVVSAVYTNPCTGTVHDEAMRFSFRVVQQDTVFAGLRHECISIADYNDPAKHDSLDLLIKNGTIIPSEAENCWDTVKIYRVFYDLETEEEYYQTERDSAFVNGQWYYASDDITWETVNDAGCKHTVTCHLHVITCLGLTISNDSAAQHICPGNPVGVAYTKKKGDLGEVQFVCNGTTTPVIMSNDNISTLLYLPTENLKPGVYKGLLKVEDPNCDALEFPIDVTVYYPGDIFKVKFNNVLAVYNSGYGGNKLDTDKEDGTPGNGYTFTGYQWYHCSGYGDCIPVEGATDAVYYAGEDNPFRLGESYYVELTRADGVVLQSCAHTITAADVPSYDNSGMHAPARKVLNNQQMYILREGQTYNIYGQHVR